MSETSTSLIFPAAGAGYDEAGAVMCVACAGAGGFYGPPPLAGKKCDLCKADGCVMAEDDFEISIRPGMRTGDLIVVNDAETWVKRGTTQQNGYPSSFARPSPLVVQVVALPHPIWARALDNLVLVKRLSFEQALCGTTIQVPHPSRAQLAIPVAPMLALQRGGVLRVRGAGLPVYAPATRQWDCNYGGCVMVTNDEEQDGDVVGGMLEDIGKHAGMWTRLCQAQTSAWGISPLQDAYGTGTSIFERVDSPGYYFSALAGTGMVRLDDKLTDPPPGAAQTTPDARAAIEKAIDEGYAEAAEGKGTAAAIAKVGLAGGVGAAGSIALFDQQLMALATSSAGLSIKKAIKDLASAYTSGVAFGRKGKGKGKKGGKGKGAGGAAAGGAGGDGSGSDSVIGSILARLPTVGDAYVVLVVDYPTFKPGRMPPSAMDHLRKALASIQIAMALAAGEDETTVLASASGGSVSAITDGLASLTVEPTVGSTAAGTAASAPASAGSGAAAGESSPADVTATASAAPAPAPAADALDEDGDVDMDMEDEPERASAAASSSASGVVGGGASASAGLGAIGGAGASAGASGSEVLDAATAEAEAGLGNAKSMARALDKLGIVPPRGGYWTHYWTSEDSLRGAMAAARAEQERARARAVGGGGRMRRAGRGRGEDEEHEDSDEEGGAAGGAGARAKKEKGGLDYSSSSSSSSSTTTGGPTKVPKKGGASVAAVDKRYTAAEMLSWPVVEVDAEKGIVAACSGSAESTAAEGDLTAENRAVSRYVAMAQTARSSMLDDHGAALQTTFAPVVGGVMAAWMAHCTNYRTAALITREIVALVDDE